MMFFMSADNFEGSILLEKLAEIGLVDQFFEAVDSDDFSTITNLLREADIDEESIQIVIKKIIDSSD